MMSIEEQDAAMLRIVKQRAETKRNKLLLENELKSLGRRLAELGYALQNMGTLPNDALKVAEKVAQSADVPNMEKIIAMSHEHAELDKTLRELNAKAKEIGID